MAPTKTIIVKNNTNEWFDGEIAERVAARDKLFRKFKKFKLSVDEILNKKARITVEALIKDKNRKLLQEKLSENKGKPKELWKIEFTRQKRSHRKHLSPYEKRVDVFSRAMANIFSCKWSC